MWWVVLRSVQVWRQNVAVHKLEQTLLRQETSDRNVLWIVTHHQRQVVDLGQVEVGIETKFHPDFWSGFARQGRHSVVRLSGSAPIIGVLLPKIVHLKSIVIFLYLSRNCCQLEFTSILKLHSAFIHFHTHTISFLCATIIVLSKKVSSKRIILTEKKNKKVLNLYCLFFWVRFNLFPFSAAELFEVFSFLVVSHHFRRLEHVLDKKSLEWLFKTKMHRDLETCSPNNIGKVTA